MTVGPDDGELAAIVLAAGAGRRFGGPKALATDAAGVPWLRRVGSLLERFAAPVIVVLGAGADEALPLVPPSAAVVTASDWQFGLSASLVAGLAAARATTAVAAIVALVDQPDLPAGVVERLLVDPIDTSTLRRVTTAAGPGHPVLLGRDHWAPIARQVTGDRGARDYLRGRCAQVEVDDLWDGSDQDTRPG